MMAPRARRTLIAVSTTDTHQSATTSQERVELALAHAEPDRVPLDLGGSAVTGMHVDSVYRLRQALGLDAPGTPVKIVEPYQMLGEIAPDLIDALGVDVVGVGLPTNFFGFENEDWKPWTTFDGTPVLVPGAFNTEPDANGDILMYPEGDTSVPPSATHAERRAVLRRDRPAGPARRGAAQRRGQPRGVRRRSPRRPWPT